MSRRKFGSKAAYEAERAGVREANAEWRRMMSRTDEERVIDEKMQRARRNLERLEDDAMMIHMMFMSAVMASGQNAAKADKEAALAADKLRARFT